MWTNWPSLTGSSVISPLTSALIGTWMTGWIFPLATTTSVRLRRVTFSACTVMTGSRLEKGFWGATLLTLIGAGIAIVGRANSTSEGAGFKGGEILIVFSLASWTVYSILAQRWFSTEVSALRRTYLSSLGAVPWLLLFWAIARVAGLVGEPNLSPSPQGWALLVAGAVFSTALATVAWNMGVARLGVQTGGMWQNAVPVFAVLISLIFFGVEPRAEQILGGLLVMAGVLYMQWHKLRAK